MVEQTNLLKTNAERRKILKHVQKQWHLFRLFFLIFEDMACHLIFATKYFEAEFVPVLIWRKIFKWTQKTKNLARNKQINNNDICI